MSDTNRVNTYMINNRTPSVYELAALAAELESENNKLRKDLDWTDFNLQESQKELNHLRNQIKQLTEELNSFDRNLQYA
jgi:chromosome segregation ATPase